MAESFTSAFAPDSTSSPSASSSPTPTPTSDSDGSLSTKTPGNGGKIAGIAVGIVAIVAIVLMFLGLHQKRKKPRAGSQPMNWSRLTHKHPRHVQRGLGLQHQVLSQYDVGRRSRSRSRASRSRSRAPPMRDIEHSPAPPRYQVRNSPPDYEEAISSMSEPPRAYAPPH